jgi:tripartite-type tricarboxylate transporter receptor subunit TctC
MTTAASSAEEAGHPCTVEGWFAVVGPAKMASADVKREHDAFVTAFATVPFIR